MDLSAPKKSKEAENVTLEEEVETGDRAKQDVTNQNEGERMHPDKDFKTLLDNTEKIFRITKDHALDIP